MDFGPSGIFYTNPVDLFFIRIHRDDPGFLENYANQDSDPDLLGSVLFHPDSYFSK